jgi:hypothetical protein
MRPTPENSPGDRRHRSGVGRLSFALFLVAAAWLFLLPWLASLPAINGHIRWLDERGIDPSAMYYTELDAMKPILRQVNDRLRRGARETDEPSIAR